MAAGADSSIVDLRSDTVTRPTPGMRACIAAAEVGDDVHGDDPTANRLQERCAALFGKEAALFVASGTMGNQVAIRSVCEPGDELICDERTHTFHYETGAAAALSGVQIHTLASERGIFSVDALNAAIRPMESHFPRTRMVIVENTNNRGGGAIWPLARMEAIRDAAHERGLHVHLDGARIMNAAVATGTSCEQYGAVCDSLSMCFSKGLGAPVGSILVGSRAFIDRAHRFRKMFGGGMRQVGLLAAAADYALDHHVEQLAEDHANARRLAEGLAKIPGIAINLEAIDTNIVIFDMDPSLGSASALVECLTPRGVLLYAIAPQRVRAVTHLDVDRAGIERAIAATRVVLGAA